MSVRDIILDRVKDRLFEILHDKPLKPKKDPKRKKTTDHKNDESAESTPSGEQTPTQSSDNSKKKPLPKYPSLKKWNNDYINDIIDLTFENHKLKIDRIINQIVYGQTDEQLALEGDRTKFLCLTELNDDLIDRIVEKISSELTLILSNNPKPPYIGENYPTKIHFPFTARSLLQMCWGMTLNFSSEASEQALGVAFNTQFSDQFKQIFTPRSTADLNDSSSIFLMNLQMAMASTVRNLALIRQTHTEYLALNADRLANRRKNLEQAADFSSFSGSGLFAKLGSFVGFGSITDLLTTLYVTPKDTSNPLNQIPIYLIPVFIIAGIVGMVGVTLLARRRVDQTDDSWDRQVKREQSRYWKEHYKRDVSDELYNFFIAVIGLVNKFYPIEERDDILNNDELFWWRQLPEVIKTVINDEILATDNLQWFPTLSAAQASSQSASNQPAATPDSGTKPADKTTKSK